MRITNSPHNLPEEQRGLRFSKTAIRNYLVLVSVVFTATVASFVFQKEISELASSVGNWYGIRFNRTPVPASENRIKTYLALPLKPLAPPVPPFSALEENVILPPPHRVTRSDTIESNEQTIKLAYVVGIGATDLCVNSEGGKFPCGLMGRATLQNLISNETLKCIPIIYFANEVRYLCSFSNIDLGESQVSKGFARPDQLGNSIHVTASQKAAKSQFGAWNGGWNTITLDQLKLEQNQLESSRNNNNSAQ